MNKKIFFSKSYLHIFCRSEINLHLIFYVQSRNKKRNRKQTNKHTYKHQAQVWERVNQSVTHYKFFSEKKQK